MIFREYKRKEYMFCNQGGLHTFRLLEKRISKSSDSSLFPFQNIVAETFSLLSTGVQKKRLPFHYFSSERRGLKHPRFLRVKSIPTILSLPALFSLIRSNRDIM